MVRLGELLAMRGGPELGVEELEALAPSISLRVKVRQTIVQFQFLLCFLYTCNKDESSLVESSFEATGN